MQALEWEFGAASHPDIDSRTVPILQWISSAAADEVIATLNVFCALNGEMLVAEPVRRRFNPIDHSRVWEKQWKTLSPTSVTIRVSISSDEARPTEIHITVNGHDVNVVPPPFNRELSTPTAADMRWLDQEVLAPISAAVARWMMQAAASKDLGYIPVGGGIDDAGCAAGGAAGRRRRNSHRVRVEEQRRRGSAQRGAQGALPLWTRGNPGHRRSLGRERVTPRGAHGLRQATLDR